VNIDSSKNLGGSIGPAIPPDFNKLSRYEAAQYYVEKLGWAILPMYGPNQGRGKERGKRPAIKNFKQHTLEETTPEFLALHFGGKKGRNVGGLIRGDFLHVDLDSKPDNGGSVMKWLSGVSSLAAVPRERTGGGVHLVFRCRDLPISIQMAKSALTKVHTAPTRHECGGESLAGFFTITIDRGILTGTPLVGELADRRQVVFAAQTLRWKIGEALKSKEVDIAINPKTPLRVLSVAGNDPAFSCELLTVEDARGYKIVITPRDTGTARVCVLQVRTDSKDPRDTLHGLFALVENAKPKGRVRP